MGKRDFRWREAKKPKKGSTKVSKVSILPEVPEAEVIKSKGRKPEEE